MKTINIQQNTNKTTSAILTVSCLLMITFLSACNEFLNTQPVDFQPPSTYYNSENNITAALAGVYNPLSNNFMYGSLLCNNINGTADEGSFPYTSLSNIFNISGSQLMYTDQNINGFWQMCYVGIERANLLIANIDNATAVDSITKGTILAEATFMRGYYHFLLVQYFGGVPIKITPSGDVSKTDLPRNTIKEVYDQVLNDMTSAEPYLYPITSPKLLGGNSRITKTAAAGILARVCLYMAGEPLRETNRYAEALAWTQKVTSANFHRLLTNTDTINNPNIKNLRGFPLAYDATLGNPAYHNNGYAQLFLNYARNVYAVSESMWEVDYYAQSATINVFGYIGSQIGVNNFLNDPVFGTCSSGMNVQHYLYNKYKEGDLRRDWAIAPYYNQNVTIATPNPRLFYNATAGKQAILNRQVGKWRREYEPLGAGLTVKPAWGTQFNFPLLRYADVLLMQAEAEYMINGSSDLALSAINQVSRRAYGFDPLTPNVKSDFSTITLADIQDERQRELCFEVNRKGDLVRWGIYFQRIQDVYTFTNTQGMPVGNRGLTCKYLNNILAGGNKYLLWPIPSQEILVNKAMTQNPGY